MKRRLMLMWMAAVAIAASVGAGSAQARLDPSFGEGGIVPLTAPSAPSGATNYFQSAYVGPGGEYFVFSRQNCPPGLNQCPNGSYLYRYLPNATVDPAFAGGHGFLAPEGGPSEYSPDAQAFATDSSGRPVYAVAIGGEGGYELIVRRVQLSGVPDAGFGSGGVVRVPCPYTCGEVEVLPRPDGSTLVTVAGEYPNGKGPAQPAIDIYALNAQGFPIRKFATPVELHVADRRTIQDQALTPGGAIYLAGGYRLGPVKESTPVNELRRISATGRLDTNFGAVVVRSLSPLLELNGEGAEIKTILVGPTGKIELFGAIGHYNGFQLRLLPSGKTDRSFGKNGLRKYQFVPREVVAGTHAATMVLATESDLTDRLYRVFADGRVDRAFGAQGEEVPGIEGEPEEVGLSLFRAGKGRVAVSTVTFGTADKPVRKNRRCSASWKGSNLARVKISQALVDEMVAHAREDLPNECCGMVGGVDGVATRVVRVGNAAATPLRYEMDPQGQFDALKEIEADGELLAIYHSHTKSAAYPSQTDVNQAQNWPEPIYVIISLADGDNPDVQAFHLAALKIADAELEVA